MAYLSDRQRMVSPFKRGKCGLCRRDAVYIASTHRPSGTTVCETCDLRAWVDDRGTAVFDAAYEEEQGIQ